jgi:hypothetical protein
MSNRGLSNWIGAFLDYTNNTEPPLLFRKWTAISCIAAALQRKVRVEWGTALVFYPNFYIVLVGPSATGKGTAMNPGLNILQDISGVRLSAQATSLQALIRHLKDTNLTDINEVTGEQQFHSSLTIFSKEFTVFLGYHNRELMAALCDWYDCDRKWAYETISRKREEINGVWVNMIAGTTPDLIRSCLPIESIGGGLTSRIIFVYGEKPDKLVTLPNETNEERYLFQYLMQDLEKISLLSGAFSWTDGFAKAWDAWCHHAHQNPPFQDPKFDGYNGRRRVHLMKLSMIHSVSRGRNILQLDESCLREAVDTLNEVEKKMGLVFKGVGKSTIAEIMHRATMYLTNSKTKTIPISIFLKYFENDLDSFTLDRVISTLEVSRIARIIRKPGNEDLIEVLPQPVG